MPKSIIAQKYKFVTGVDTHAKTHHLTLLDNLGIEVGAREIKVLPHHMEKAIDWVLQKTDGNVLFAVEGTSTYGETFTIALQNRNIAVCEVKPPEKKRRGQAGKTDEVDSFEAAKGVLPKHMNELIIPKTQGMRKVFRILLAARRNMTIQKVMDENTLIALLRTNNLTPRPVASLTMSVLQDMAEWVVRPKSDMEVEISIARMEAKRLAQNILLRHASLKQNERQIHKAVQMFAPSLLDLLGVGPVTSAQILCSYSHKGRFRSANAFACLAGTTPLEVSSGQVKHHRLSRYGDRALNCALNTIILTRMRYHEPTREYIAKCTTNGKSKRDIRRCLKRYLARSVFKHLEGLDLNGDYSIEVDSTE